MVPLVGSDNDWAFFNLGLGYLVNILYPWLQLYTNPGLNGNDTSCYDSCSVNMLFVVAYFVPHLFIYGIPLVSMILYSTVGKLFGTSGAFVKFAILYWARYLGLLWHIIMVIVSTA